MPTAPDKTASAGRNAPREALPQRNHRCSMPSVGFRELLLQPSGNGGHVNLRLSYGLVVLEPAHHVQEMAIIRLRLIHLQRQPDLEAVDGELEGVGHDSDDRENLVIEADALSDHARDLNRSAPAKGRFRSGPLARHRTKLRSGEGPAQLRSDTQRLEESSGNPSAHQLDRLASSGQDGKAGPDGGHRFKRTALLTPRHEIQRRCLPAPPFPRLG